MDLPPDLLLRTPEEGARRIALAFLGEARAASLRLDDADDVEALHDFRVAIRRLRSTLRAWRPELASSISKKQRRALKDLQAATGGGRDAEVALAWLERERPSVAPTHRHGLEWMVKRLVRRRREAMGRVTGDVRREFDRWDAALRNRLSRMRVEHHLAEESTTPAFAAVAAIRLREHMQDLLDHLLRIEEPGDRELCHDTRIRCKRLRYLLEPLRPFVKPAVGAVKRCKKLQDVLGDLNDTHVLRDDLGVALAEAATEQARELHRLVEEEDPAAVRRQMRRSPRSGLLEVIRRDHARTRALFEELESDWVETGAAPLRKAVERVAVRLEAAAQEGEEIERKFLLNALPVPPETPEVLEIDQGWLPGKDIKERIRRVQANGASHYVRTIKMGQGIRRTEVEEPITESLFQALWPLTEGRRIRKIRRRIPDGERTWEVDEFLDRDLVVAEVELSDVTEEVVLPEWLAPTVVRDVTDEPGYTNYELAT